MVNFVCLSVSQSFIHNCHPSRHSIVARLFSCGRKVPPLFRPADYGIWFLLVPQAAFAFKWQTGNGFCQSKKDARLSNSMVEGRRLSISRPEYTTATNREGKKGGSYKIAADWRCHTKDPLSGATAILYRVTGFFQSIWFVVIFEKCSHSSVRTHCYALTSYLTDAVCFYSRFQALPMLRNQSSCSWRMQVRLVILFKACVGLNWWNYQPC